VAKQREFWQASSLNCGHGEGAFLRRRHRPRRSPVGLKQMTLTAVFQEVPEGDIAFVEELPGANTQGPTIEEARANLAEAVTLVMGANRQLAEESLGSAVVIREPFFIPAA